MNTHDNDIPDDHTPDEQPASPRLDELMGWARAAATGARRTAFTAAGDAPGRPHERFASARGAVRERVEATLTPEELATASALVEKLARALGASEADRDGNGRGFGPGFGRGFRGFGPGARFGAAFGERFDADGDDRSAEHCGHGPRGGGRGKERAYERGFTAGFTAGARRPHEHHGHGAHEHGTHGRDSKGEHPASAA